MEESAVPTPSDFGLTLTQPQYALANNAISECRLFAVYLILIYEANENSILVHLRGFLAILETLLQQHAEKQIQFCVGFLHYCTVNFILEHLINEFSTKDLWRHVFLAPPTRTSPNICLR